jgi:hypothetical protein
MPSYVVSLLLSIAAVSATFAGFSGVVAVFGRRAHGRWFLEERLRLTNMLLLSLGACLLAFIPLVEDLLHLPEQTLWRIASIVLGIFCGPYFLYVLPRWWRISRIRPGRLPVWAMLIFAPCIGVAAVLQVLNATAILFNSGPVSYIAGLWLLLLAAGHQFAFLILDVEKDDSEV